MGDEDDIPRAALAAGGVSRSRRFQARRSPTTGHRVRRPQTPEPGQDAAKDKRVKRSVSSPGEFRRNISSSSEEDEGKVKKKEVKAHAEPPKPVLRKRVRSQHRSSEESNKSETKEDTEKVQTKKEEPKKEETKKEDVVSQQSWWKPWQSWSGQPRGKSLEREPGSSSPPQAVPRRRNRSLTRPSSNQSTKKRNASLSVERPKKEKSPMKTGTKDPNSKSLSQDRKKLMKQERTSFDDSSDEFWKSNDIEAALRRLQREVKEIPQQGKPMKTPKKYLKALEVKQETVKEDVPVITLRQEWKSFLVERSEDVKKIRLLRNSCTSSLLVLIIYCGLGGMVFRFTEGAFESYYKCGVKRVKRDFVDTLWSSSHNLREEEWKSLARRKLMIFEDQLHEAFEAGSTSYSGQKSWSFLNAVLYCLTVVTTIGYGHISPSTTTGRAITIIYAIFGIPLFLILLADFGKLFTRGIKFIWAFVRRVYYTGSCRKVRRTVPVQEVMKGVQMVYDIATFRRPSQIPPGTDVEGAPPLPPRPPYPQSQNHSAEPPGTPALSTFAVDDEFNLPISVAICILVVYIFCGATVFYVWEKWGFFESFYFVFISMSTIGFGDFVPQIKQTVRQRRVEAWIQAPWKHVIYPNPKCDFMMTNTLSRTQTNFNQMYMMASIVYLVFGLALTSMCINVVQEKLSDTFRQASAKIGATIGLQVSEEDGAVTPAKPQPVELAEVHGSFKKTSPEQSVSETKSTDSNETKKDS